MDGIVFIFFATLVFLLLARALIKSHSLAHLPRLAREVIYSLEYEPHTWSVRNTAMITHESGLSLWRANGVNSLRAFAPGELSLGDLATKRVVYAAIKSWEANCPLDGYKKPEVDTPTCQGASTFADRLHFNAVMKKDTEEALANLEVPEGHRAVPVYVLGSTKPVRFDFEPIIDGEAKS